MVEGRCRADLHLAMSVPCAIAGTQKTFDSPEVAVEALVDSLARNDDAEMRAILGLNYGRLVSLDDLRRMIALPFSRPGKRAPPPAGQRQVGAPRIERRWTLPIPVVRTGSGWIFDTRAGKDEMRTRRIGRNELAAIETMYAYVDAQRSTPSGTATATAFSNSRKRS